MEPALHGFVTGSALSGAKVGVAYTMQVVAQPSQQFPNIPVNIVFAGAALPPGLQHNNGTISGTPTTAGTYQFVLDAYQNEASCVHELRLFTIVVGP